MKPKSWNINRRQFVRGGGVALALPVLQGMSWGKTAGKGLPKRMVVSYIAYGVYEPKTEDAHITMELVAVQRRRSSCFQPVVAPSPL